MTVYIHLSIQLLNKRSGECCFSELSLIHHRPYVTLIPALPFPFPNTITIE